MKNLLLMLALSLVMVAYDKDEYRDNRELSYWDKVASEMTRTKMSAAEVLNSLQDNEFWYQNASSNFYKQGKKVREYVHQPEGKLLVGGSIMRFVDNTLYYYGIGNADVVCSKYEAEIVDKNNIQFYFEGKEVFKWKISAYDNDKIIIETYSNSPQRTDKVRGKWLYGKKLYIRKVDDSKWWNWQNHINRIRQKTRIPKLRYVFFCVLHSERREAFLRDC